MARYMSKLVAGAVLAGGAALAAGCHADGDHNGHCDPCWPDRYANESRAALVANFQPQVENGQVLDQTVWNMHFEFGTDKLNGGGMDKLDQLARRRPHRPAGVHPGPRPCTTRPNGRLRGRAQELTPGDGDSPEYLAASLTDGDGARHPGMTRPCRVSRASAANRPPTGQQRVAGPVTVPAGTISPAAGGGTSSGTSGGGSGSGSGSGSGRPY